MNISTHVLYPVITTSILMLANDASVIAGEATVPSPTLTKLTASPAVAESVVVRFTPVPDRRVVRSGAPLQVASHSAERNARSYEIIRHGGEAPTGILGIVGNALLKRVADFKSHQEVDILVPQPRDPGRPVVSTRSRDFRSFKTRSGSSAGSTSVGRRTPVGVHTTVGIRKFH